MNMNINNFLLFFLGLLFFIIFFYVLFTNKNVLTKFIVTKDSEKPYLYSVSDNVYRVKSFETGFKQIFDDLTKIDMVEGLVLKRKSAKLEIGNTENNNTKSQLKARKATKNYKY